MPVTTRAAAKAYKGLVGVEMDAVIDALIPRVQAVIESFLSRRLDVQQHSDEYHGTGAQALQLREWPVVSVQSVTVDGQPIPAGGFTSPGWRPVGQMLVLNGYRFTRGFGNVHVTYTAGYDTMPAEIEQAAIETLWLTIERRTHLDVTSKGLAGETVSYVMGEFTPAVRQMLAPHVRVAQV